jgi:two-component system phosphate regulon sensor histidine kinase PhoR
VIELHNRTAEADISRAHTDFVANASHELRTPLASIIGYVETLVEEDGDVDPPTTAKFLETVLREARRLQNLVNDLMSLSRIEAEKHDRPSENIDLAKLVPKAAKEAGSTKEKSRIHTHAPDSEVMIQGDTQQLEQLIRNLVDNALKYGSQTEPVDVAVRTDEDRAVLTVTDRGEGIDPEHIPHHTRRFYRTDPGRSRAAGGTGLGLAIVKHIVERHRGRLDIESKRGEGTVVTVRLPLAGAARA